MGNLEWVLECIVRGGTNRKKIRIISHMTSNTPVIIHSLKAIHEYKDSKAYDE